MCLQLKKYDLLNGSVRCSAELLLVMCLDIQSTTVRDKVLKQKTLLAQKLKKGDFNPFRINYGT